MNFRVGTLVFMINGTQFALAGDFTINPGGLKRESVMGPDGTRATKETYEPASCEGDLRDHGDLDVQALKNIEGVTITAEMANGKAWVLVNSTQTGDCSVGTAEGTIGVRFDADRAFELT